MNENKFKEYAEIKNQIKELTAKSKEIQKEVQEEMEQNEIDKVESDFGSFYFTTRKSYSFSDKVEKLEESRQKKYDEVIQPLDEKIEGEKEKEKEDGTAEVKESKSLTFRASK